MGGIISYDIKFNYLFQQLRKASESGKVEYMNCVKLTLEQQQELSPVKIEAPTSSSILSRRNVQHRLSPISDSSIVDEVLAKSRMSLSSLGSRKNRQEEIYSPLEMIKSKSNFSQKRRGKQIQAKAECLDIMTPTELNSHARLAKPMTTDDIDDPEAFPVLSLNKHSSLQTYDRGKQSESLTTFSVIDELSDSSD